MIKGIVPADRPLPALHNIISSSTNVFPLTSTLCLMSMISVYVTSQSQEPKQSGAAKTKEKVREGRGVFFYLWKRPLTDATMKFKFKEERTLEQRKGEASKIREKYPERIPVIVEKEPRSQIQPLGKRKFLVPSEISVAQFMWIVRKRIQLTQVQALYLFVGKSLPQSSATMYEVYERHKDEDGFLYIAYSGENTFGSCDNE